MRSLSLLSLVVRTLSVLIDSVLCANTLLLTNAFGNVPIVVVQLIGKHQCIRCAAHGVQDGFAQIVGLNIAEPFVVLHRVHINPRMAVTEDLRLVQTVKSTIGP